MDIAESHRYNIKQGLHKHMNKDLTASQNRFPVLVIITLALYCNLNLQEAN